jgi:hypothetical protein
MRDVEYGNYIRQLLNLYTNFFSEGLMILEKIKDDLDIPKGKILF